MPFTHHTHSSTFCSHAVSPLPEMLRLARAFRFHTFSLTEHFPRDHPADLYPEELAEGLSCFDLFSRFDGFVRRAREVQRESEDAAAAVGGDAQDGGGPRILVGGEAEYIRASSIELIRAMQDKYELDFLLGSVHHVNGVPIDFSREMYEKARETCGGSEAGLFEVYFDHQYEILREIKPAVVGHWDLIRLFCDDKTKPLEEYGEGVWSRVVRNAELVASYGGLVELNSAALRKGWDTPYPGRDVVALLRDLGVRFCLCDDAHGTQQVGLNYDRVVKYCEEMGIEKVYYLEKLPMGQIAREMLGGLQVKEITLEEVRRMPFWEARRKALEEAEAEKQQ